MNDQRTTDTGQGYTSRQQAEIIMLCLAYKNMFAAEVMNDAPNMVRYAQMMYDLQNQTGVRIWANGCLIDFAKRAGGTIVLPDGTGATEAYEEWIECLACRGEGCNYCGNTGKAPRVNELCRSCQGSGEM